MKGKATIRILMSELKPRYRTNIEIVAKVTESVTGIEATGTGAVTIHETPEKLMFSSGMPSVFKPGLQYTIVVSCCYITRSVRYYENIFIYCLIKHKQIFGRY